MKLLNRVSYFDKKPNPHDRKLYVFFESLHIDTEKVSFIKPCVIDDEACVLKEANRVIPFFLKGIPEMGIDPLEPMFIPKIFNDNAGLKLTFTNNYVKGLSSCALTNIKSELVTKKFHRVTIKCSNVLVEGKYNVDGQLLIFAIQGNGNFKIGLRDVVIKVNTNLTMETGADGKVHSKITDWRHTFKVQTGATFDFENLFNGNKVLAEPIVQYMNENWKDVLQTAGPPIHTAIVQVIIDDINKLHEYSAMNELYQI